jgi:chromosome segregation ATPase
VSFAEETLADIASVATFDELVAAKTKEIYALIASIEDKTTAIGELGVQIVSMKEDLSDCEVTLLEDKKSLADLEKNCAVILSQRRAA